MLICWIAITVLCVAAVLGQRFIAGLFVTTSSLYTTNYYVDSIGGNDVNPGTLAQPFQNLSAIQALADAHMIPEWTAIHLKRGSSWIGAAATLNIDVSNVVVLDYDVGALPIIDGRVVMAAGGFTKTGGRTFVYQYEFTALIDTAEQANIWEDGVRLIRADDVADCDATPGSYWVPPEGPAWVEGDPVTYYVHASDDSDPATNGKVYTTQGVIWCAQLGSTTSVNNKLYNVEAMGACHHNGNVVLGRDSYANGVIVRWGTVHSLYTDSGFFIDCVSYDCEQGFDFVANKGGASDGFIEMNGCIATVDETSGNIQGPAFFVHGTTQTTIRYIDCSSTHHLGGFGVNGIGQNGQQILCSGCSVTCPTDATQLKSYDINTVDNGGVFTSTVTLEDCLSDGYGLFFWGFGLNDFTTVVINKARAVVRGAGSPAVQFRRGSGVEIKYSSFYGATGAYSGIEMTVDGTACNCHHNVFDNFNLAGATEQFNATVWTATNNVYYRSTGWRVAGNYYASFAAYQTGVAPQDANAVVADPLWVQDPSIAHNFNVQAGSPADTLDAGWSNAP